MGLFSKRKTNEAFKEFCKVCKQLQVYKIYRLFSLEVIMVENLIKKILFNFVVIIGLLIIFLAQRKPQQNSAVEKKSYVRRHGTYNYI